MKFLQLSLAAGLLFSVSYSAWAGPDVYLVGDMSGWNVQDTYKMTEVSDGVYTYDAASLSQSFKFASTDGATTWEGTYNLGPDKSNADSKDNVTVTLDGDGKARVDLIQKDGGNIKPSAAWENVTLTLYAKAEKPYVTIAPTEKGGDDSKYELGWALNGQFTGSTWAVTKFNSTDVEGVWSVTITPTQGAGKFGVMSLNEKGDQKDWYGCEAELSESNPEIAIKTGGDSSFTLTANKEYTFVLDERGATPTLTVSWKDQPEQPEQPEFKSSTTVYFINKANWEKPRIYLYKVNDDGSRPVKAEWPGQELNSGNGLTVNTVKLTDNSGNDINDVYSITWNAEEGWTNVIFNCGEKVSSLMGGQQTADCGIENRGVYSNAKHSEFGGETEETNGHYNNVGPIAYSVDGFYYPAQQSAATEEFKCFYNDHLDWNTCWVYINQGGETKTRKMYKGQNQFGRECWVLPTKEDMEALGAKEEDLISLSTALKDFQIWFANGEEDNSNGARRKKGTTLQNFEIYEDADVKVTIDKKEYDTYNGIMTLYVKGNVYVNGVSAQDKPQLLKRNPQAGRFYAKVKPIEGTDGKFFLVRKDSENTDVTNNIWVPENEATETLVAGGEKHYTLTAHGEKTFNSVDRFYVLDNTAASASDGTSVLVVKMREKSIHNIIPSPELKINYETQMGNSDLDGVNKTTKHGRVQRHGGLKLNVTASNYFEDFSKCSLKFNYKPGNGGSVEDVANYVEPVFFGLHENEGTPSTQADNAVSSNGSSVIGTYRVFFMTPGIYTVTVANDQGEDPIYNTMEASEAETAAYATPLSIGMQVNYANVVAETTANPDDAANFISKFPNYTVWFAWCDGEKDKNANIVKQLVSGKAIKSGDVKTGNEDYDAKAQDKAVETIWYVRATPENARLSYSEELNANPAAFEVWIPAELAAKNPSENGSVRRAVANPTTAPTGYVKYDPYNGINLSSVDDFNVIIDQNGVRSEAYNVKANKISDVTTGVENIEAEEAFVEEVAPVYYNLNGLMVNGENLTPGIYVEVRGSKTRKIIVR